MHIYLEEPGRLKITLTEAELRRFSLSYDQLDYDDPATRRALGTLMAEASAETGFDFQPGRLLIEVFPAPAGGCEMYFTLLADPADGGPAGGDPARRAAKLSAGTEPQRGQQRLRLKRPAGAAYTFEFESAEDMLAAMEQLYSSPAAASADSDLYAWNSRYRLIFRPRPGERFSPLCLSEYSTAFYHTAAAAAGTPPHRRLLAGGRAVDLVGGALLKKRAR